VTNVGLTAEERMRSHPGWFSGVMGTASLAVAAFRLPDDSGVTETYTRGLGWLFLVLSILGLIVIVAANTLARTPWSAIWRELRSRQRGPAYAAVPGAVLLITMALEAALPNMADIPTLGWVLMGITLVVAVADLLLTLVFFSSAIANTGALEDDAVSGVWFMPQTILLLSAAAFARLSSTGIAGLDDVAAPLAVLFLGAGFLLFLFVGALVLSRLVAAPLTPASGVPAAWILMSPSAAAAVAFMAIPVVTPTLIGQPSSSVTPITSLVAGMMIGFCIWWLLVVGILTIRDGREFVTFSPASWSYVFPLAAVAVASGDLAQAWSSPLMVLVAVVMACLGAASWLIIVVISMRWVAARRWNHA
jgi:tellurite resistance protein TehA-like permease